MKSKNDTKASLSSEKPFVTYFSGKRKVSRERLVNTAVCRCCHEVKRIAQQGKCFGCVAGDCRCLKLEYANEPAEEEIIEAILNGTDTKETWHWKRIFDARKEAKFDTA